MTAEDVPTSRAGPGSSAPTTRPRDAGWDLLGVLAHLLLAGVPVALVVGFLGLVLQRLG